jgi:hypothetical protein
MALLDVPIPRRMNALGRDSRGYPIPFNVKRDRQGQPHFAVTDELRQIVALKDQRCSICGTRIQKAMWFFGGPRSAFHPAGGYLDPAMHHECMQYAAQVCPYLAVPRYLSRVAESRVSLAGLEDEILIDPTVEDGRPAFFVAVSTNRYRMGTRVAEGGMTLLPVIHPERPYLALEYWRHGQQLSREEVWPELAAMPELEPLWQD